MRVSPLLLLLLLLLFLIYSVRSITLSASHEEYDSDDAHPTQPSSVPSPQSASAIPITLQKPQEDAAEEYDEDEFIVTKKQPDPPKIKVIGSPDTEIKPNQPAPPRGPRSYLLEIFFVTLIIIYGVNYWLGRRTNAALASKWALSHRDLLHQNFSKVGDHAILIRQSVHRFRLKATGRRNVRGLQAMLDLVRRHDAASLFLRLFNIGSEPDMVTVDVPMRDQCLDSFVFAIVKRKIESDFRKDNPEIAPFCTVGSGGLEVPDSFTVYSEHAELPAFLFASNLAKILDEYENDIQAIYVTDQCTTSNYRKTLRFVYRIQPRNVERSLEIFKFILSFIDLVAQVRLSKQAQERAEKRRRKILEMADKQTYAQRQEALQKKRAEEYAKMSPEEKAKRDEKEARKAQKRKMKFKVQIA